MNDDSSTNRSLRKTTFVAKLCGVLKARNLKENIWLRKGRPLKHHTSET